MVSSIPLFQTIPQYPKASYYPNRPAFPAGQPITIITPPLMQPLTTQPQPFQSPAQTTYARMPGMAAIPAASVIYLNVTPSVLNMPNGTPASQSQSSPSGEKATPSVTQNTTTTPETSEIDTLSETGETSLTETSAKTAKAKTTPGDETDAERYGRITGEKVTELLENNPDLLTQVENWDERFDLENALSDPDSRLNQIKDDFWDYNIRGPRFLGPGRRVVGFFSRRSKRLFRWVLKRVGNSMSHRLPPEARGPFDDFVNWFVSPKAPALNFNKKSSSRSKHSPLNLDFDI